MELELNWVGSDTGLAVLARARLFLECARSRRHLPNGQIASAIGDKCIGTVGGAVVLAVCDGASAWEAQGNGATHLIRRALLTFALHCVRIRGQLRSGQNCLSQDGPAAGAEDAAARGALSVALV